MSQGPGQQGGPPQGTPGVVPHEWEEGSVQWLWNQFCALRTEANAGSSAAISRMEWVLDTIIRYRLVPFVDDATAKEIPDYDTCEARVRARVAKGVQEEYRSTHSGWDAEELASLIEDGVQRAAIEARADPVARILARLGWLEPLRPVTARV